MTLKFPGYSVAKLDNGSCAHEILQHNLCTNKRDITESCPTQWKYISGVYVGKFAVPCDDVVEILEASEARCAHNTVHASEKSLSPWHDREASKYGGLVQLLSNALLPREFFHFVLDLLDDQSQRQGRVKKWITLNSKWSASKNLAVCRYTKQRTDRDTLEMCNIGSLPLDN